LPLSTIPTVPPFAQGGRACERSSQATAVFRHPRNVLAERGPSGGLVGLSSQRPVAPRDVDAPHAQIVEHKLVDPLRSPGLPFRRHTTASCSGRAPQLDLAVLAPSRKSSHASSTTCMSRPASSARRIRVVAEVARQVARLQGLVGSRPRPERREKAARQRGHGHETLAAAWATAPGSPSQREAPELTGRSTG